MNKNTPVSWLRDLCGKTDRLSASILFSSHFINASDKERKDITEEWPLGVEWPYPTGSRLACAQGERFSSKERILCSLLLDSLNGLFGSREQLIALSETYRSCELAGLSASEIFNRVAQVIPDDHVEILTDFLQRSPADRSLSVFCLVERVNQDGEIEIHLEF